jgi:hypothetical protein
MNSIIPILACNNAFLYNPRSAFLLRVSSKSLCDEFDKNLNPVTWWFWIQCFLIPKIVGLPSNLKAEFYKSMIQKYFAPAPAIWTRMRCQYMYLIGSQMYDQNRTKVHDVLCTHKELMHTAKGRAFFMDMVSEWGRCLGENHRSASAVHEIKQYIEYSFTIGYEGVIIGHKQEPDRASMLALEDSFVMWRMC